MRKIIYYPNPILKETANPVTSYDEELTELVNDMRETMYESRGIGLAAPQIGVLTRVIVVDVSDDQSGFFTLINPEIISHSGTERSQEGCLSIPEYRETINRHKSVTVTGNSLTGEIVTLEAQGLLGFCLQHEIDHLNGILFIDRLSRLKKEFFNKWWQKQLLEQNQTI